MLWMLDYDYLDACNRADSLWGFDNHNGTTSSNWDSCTGTQHHVGVDADTILPF